MSDADFSFGVVAAGHLVTAQAAMEILEDGGNAFDAMIAALWTACVVEPVLASPGGGGFLMAHADGVTELLDFFVDSPRAKRPSEEVEFVEKLADFGTATQAFHIGRGACATPGYVPGLFDIARRHGSLPMSRLTEPATRAARDGVPMTAFQAYLFSVVEPILTWTDEVAHQFAPEGRLLEEGETYRNPDLANVLEAAGREGADWWTMGDMAAAMLTGQDRDGYLGAEDLAGYRTVLRSPLEINFGDWRVHLNPLPSLGGALIAAMSARLPGGPDITALDLARAIDTTDRMWRQAPEDGARLLDAADGPANGGLAIRGTTHVSILDTHGNAASATVSNGEGNGRMVPGAGFMVNNMLGEADVNPAGFHAWQPGRRLGSMMSPTIGVGPPDAVGSPPILALGSGGSNRIRTAVLQVLAGRLRGGRDLAHAVNHPRLHIEKGHLDVEAGLAETEIGPLLAAFTDHRVWPEPNLYFGGVHAAEHRPGEGVAGVGDRRREGVYLCH